MDTEISNVQPLETEFVEEIKNSTDVKMQVKKVLNSPSACKRLEQILEQMHIINQLLEELSIEKSTEISQKQWLAWKEFKSSTEINIKPRKFWQKSLFARTYYIDKDLDTLFHNIIKYRSMLCNSLDTFKDKLQSRNNIIKDDLQNASEEQFKNLENIETTKEMTTKESETTLTTDSPYQQLSNAAVVTSIGNNEKTDHSLSVNIRQIFTDLIKAKINFDTQFLEFNTILDKNCYSKNFQCIHKIFRQFDIALAQELFGINKRKRNRKRLNNNFVKKSKKSLRRSARIASEDNLSEVQIIRSLRRKNFS